MEVKSYACDICGAVHHAEQDSKERTVIVTEEGNYEHLCPICERYIKRYVKDPSVADEHYKEHKAIDFLEDCVAALNRKLGGSAFFFGRGVENHEYYDEIKNKCITAIEELKNERDTYAKRCKILASITAGLGLWLTVGSIVSIVL